MKPWYLRLIPYARPHRGGLAKVLLLTFAGIGIAALLPWPLKLIVDHVLADRPLPDSIASLGILPGSDNSTALLAWLAAISVMLFLLRWMISTVRAYLQAGIANRMVYALGTDILVHLQRLSMRFHGRSQTGDLARRVTTDSSCVRELLTGTFLPAITSLATLITMFAIMWQLDPDLSLIAITVALPLGLLIRLLTPRMTQRVFEQQEFEGGIWTLAETTLTSLPVVQAFGREQHEYSRFRDLADQTVQASLRALTSQLQFNFGVGFTTAIGTALIFGIGGMHVLEGSLTVGSLLVILAYLTALYGPVETLASLTAGFAAAAGRARRVFTILDTSPDVVDPEVSKPLPRPRRGQAGHIRIENVTFGYEPGKPVLHGINLDAPPGKMIALVGHTGAGKSTLVSLIPRFFDPWQGRITIDGVDLRELRLMDVRAQVALVLQEPFLLPLTIAENIAFGRPEASAEEVVEAAQAANADQFIRALPAGYDTVLSERGASLSGGEKQRISIARALLKDAPVLILDEPTSALDAETEETVMQAVGRLNQGRTAIVIAHRLSTVRRADQIVVLDDGRIVQVGTHDELHRTDGPYRNLLTTAPEFQS